MFILYMIIVSVVASYISACGGDSYPSKNGSNNNNNGTRQPKSSVGTNPSNTNTNPSTATTADTSKKTVITKPTIYFLAKYYTENGRTFMPCDINIGLSENAISFNGKELYVKDGRMYTESTIDHTITSVPISVKDDEFHIGNIVYLKYLKEIKKAKVRLKEKKSENTNKNTQKEDKVNTHVVYTVEPKDTWTSVSKKFNVTTYNLMRKNPNIRDLKVGDKITIN